MMTPEHAQQILMGLLAQWLSEPRSRRAEHTTLIDLIPVDIHDKL